MSADPLRTCTCGSVHVTRFGARVSSAEPLLYADRAERYLRQRGIPRQRGITYSPYNLSVHLLTARQRRRALKKEAHALRKLGWTS